jgi:hypothetical protein
MRSSLALSLLVLALPVACGQDATPDKNSKGGGAGSALAGSASAGLASGGGSNAGTASVSGGAGSGTLAGSGGDHAAGSEATAGRGGASSGGNASGAGNGGASNGGAGNGGASNPGGCTRALLESAVDAYFKALALHTPESLPLAPNVKFTENGKASKLGDAGLWKTAGALKYAHSALDTELCMSASEAVVPDGATDVPVALRLRLQDQKLTEVESIVARAGDYTAVDANPTALAASNDVVKWEEAVPADQRAKREELTGWMEKYFKQFPAGVCNTTSDCKRMENGGGSFVCGQGASCAAASSGQPVLNPRLVMADVDTGLGVGFTIFTGGYVDMHLFKMRGGKVYAVSAILANGNSSGWE